MKSRWILSVWVAIGSVPWVANLSEAATSDRDRVPVQIVQTTEAIYPPALLMEGVSSGEVWMLITVDDTGTLTDAMITRTTHQGFAPEALRVARGLTYRPARIDGNPVSVRTEIHLSFESTGQVMTLDSNSTLQQLIAFAGRGDFINHLCTPNELDGMPTLLQTVAPLHPRKANDGSATEGRAVLDFIIDENGKPRMPVVLSSTDIDFAAAAASALAQWRFTPPSRRGQPVAVQVRQEFIFSPSTDSDTAAGASEKRLSASANDVALLAL
jgi:TonB family protein